MKKKSTLCIGALIAAAFLVLLFWIPGFGTIGVEASSVRRLNVAGFKGSRDPSAWLVPSDEGKVFAGWFSDQACTTPYTALTGAAYAKFVDAKTIAVKKQLPAGFRSTDASTSLRFLTAVDSFQYDSVFFTVAVPSLGKSWTMEEKTAYASIRVSGLNEPLLASDERAFGTPDATYFVIHTLAGIPKQAYGETFTVSASYRTLDGTVVTGETSSFAIEEAVFKDSLFTDQVTVNEMTLLSVMDHWDVAKIRQNIVRASSELGSSLQPIYFAATGREALLRAEVTVTNTTAGDPMAGLWIHDGSGRSFIGVRGGGLYMGVKGHSYDEWYGSGEDWPFQALAPSWNGPASVTLEILVKNGTITVRLNDTYETSLPLSTLIADYDFTKTLAFGLVSYTNGTRAYDMTFHNVSFTTDPSEINAYLGIEETSIDFGTGLREDLQYRDTLYGLNGSNDVEGADPGAFYVSEAEDPVYGGYFYMYLTGSTRDEYGVDDLGVNAYAFRCYRSKDLYTWEPAGALRQGYSLMVDWADWAMNAFWAPEVIRNPEDGKYYMYFSAASRPDWGVEGMSSNSSWADKLYLGVAVASSPVGPFDVLYDVDPATGKRMPTINFRTGCGTASDWPAIDASPFFDDDGTLYLYFNKHAGSTYASLYGVWGVKMNSMTAPDYTTVSFLAKPNYTTVPAGTYTMESFTGSISGNRYEFSEGSINEAPFMTKHNGKYYLTYASNGYSSKNYSVHQAISDTPLGSFVKLTSAEGNPVLSGADHGGSTYNYVNGTAHHAIVSNDDGMWIVYHKHNSTKGVDEGLDRSISADRILYITNASGTDVLTACGPTLGLTALPESVSGFSNLAKTASIRTSDGTGTAYLTDDLLPFYPVVRDRVMTVENGCNVTLSWTEPVRVSSLMVFNAYERSRAFTALTDLRFKIAGQASAYAVIPKLRFPERYLLNGTGAYVPLAPAVAEVEALWVTEISFTVYADHAVDLSEIVVLGHTDHTLDSLSSFESFCHEAQDERVTIDGVLDESLWSVKKRLTASFDSDAGNTMPRLSTTGWADRYGVYIASEVTDSNLVNDGQHTMTENSAFEYYIAASADVRNVWQTYHVMIDLRGDCHSETATHIRRAVTVVEDQAAVELFIPWKALGVDVENGIPDSFRLYPTYRARLSGSSSVTTMDGPDGITADDVEHYFLFDAFGYHDKDLFGTEVDVNGRTVTSCTTNWNLAEAPLGIVKGSYAMGSSLRPVWFSETGSAMLFHATIAYSTSFASGGTYQSDLLGGIFVSDGVSSEPIGYRQHGVVYTRSLKWIEHAWPYDVLSRWAPAHLSIEADIAFLNGVFYIFLDGVYSAELPIADLMSASGSEFAFGLAMHSDKDADITFSGIRYTTDEAEVRSFLTEKGK